MQAGTPASYERVLGRTALVLAGPAFRCTFGCHTTRLTIVYLHGRGALRSVSEFLYFARAVRVHSSTHTREYNQPRACFSSDGTQVEKTIIRVKVISFPRPTLRHSSILPCKYCTLAVTGQASVVRVPPVCVVKSPNEVHVFGVDRMCYGFYLQEL